MGTQNLSQVRLGAVIAIVPRVAQVQTTGIVITTNEETGLTLIEIIHKLSPRISVLLFFIETVREEEQQYRISYTKYAYNYYIFCFQSMLIT